MPCAIAITNSPTFSTSQQTPKVINSPFFCKPSSMQSPVNRSSFYASSSLSPVPAPAVICQSPLSPLTKSYNRNLREEEEPAECSTSSTSTTTEAILKRKRPARISIPIVSLGLGHVGETPKEESRLDELEVEKEGYSVFCKRGKKRGDMEDRYSAVVNDDAKNGSKQAFFGVFDGHGGAKAAEFAAMNLGWNVLNEVSLRSEEGLEEAVREGYLTTDAEFLKLNANGGSCCVTALVHNGELIVSNAGDCRAVMSRGGVAEALTVDHRPSRQDEMERIQRLGGYVDCCRGVWRIQGSLAVSRGIGDSQLKRWVIAEPETKILKVQPECEFLILASDGLWEQVSNQEAVELLRPFCVGVDNQQPLSACKMLVDLAVTRGSSDDISAMVIQLGQFVQ
ncbi:probable protein phosphatase 2C 2 [Solanum dulcamara]|uniref:probable protein phosphatase 2C 2 n=1 Tax=Solanum dulcamara TaxID=45834 RepID=UPI002485662C|nr:probable protein phosphatase 2C 2 [Solanum dulcamara]